MDMSVSYEHGQKTGDVHITLREAKQRLTLLHHPSFVVFPVLTAWFFALVPRAARSCFFGRRMLACHRAFTAMAHFQNFLGNRVSHRIFSLSFDCVY